MESNNYAQRFVELYEKQDISGMRKIIEESGVQLVEEFEAGELQFAYSRLLVFDVGAAMLLKESVESSTRLDKQEQLEQLALCHALRGILTLKKFGRLN